MSFRKPARRSTALLAVATASTLFAAACSAGSLGSSSGGGSAGGGSAGGTTITFLVDNGPTTVASANAIISAFKAANPGINVKLDTRPGGSDGDNIVKTRLSTSTMDDVFEYNNGSLLQAIKPTQNLLPLDDQSWASTLDKTLVDSSKGTDGKLYGGAWGTASGGGVLYNVPLYNKLHLKVPTTWDQFMKNNDAIKKAGGVAPVIQTYNGTSTWTSQLFVLGDYHNVEAQVPDFAAKYTAGQDKFANTPAAMEGFVHQQQLHDGGYYNKDYRSADLNAGLKMVATGTGAHYPQLSSVAAGIDQVAPGKGNDVGFFAMPGKDAATNGMTLWPGAGIYIPKATTGAKLDAAKKLLDFVMSQPGCDAFLKGSPPTGPFLTSNCKLPSNVSRVAKDVDNYIKAGKASPALEFKSPIKGPALEQICIQVGTGQVNAQKGAQLYDEDVKKQAQQLGLPGWG